MRKPPPKEYQFLPGQSGFPQGKPKGAVSRRKLIQKVLQRRHAIEVEGERTSRTLLELVIMKLKSMAMEGNPGAANLLDWVRARIDPSAAQSEGGFLVVPQPFETDEEVMEAFRRFAEEHPHEPGSEEWYRCQAHPTSPKTRKTIDPNSPFGRAMQEFERKWGHPPSLG